MNVKPIAPCPPCKYTSLWSTSAPTCKHYGVDRGMRRVHVLQRYGLLLSYRQDLSKLHYVQPVSQRTLCGLYVQGLVHIHHNHSFKKRERTTIQLFQLFHYIRRTHNDRGLGLIQNKSHAVKINVGSYRNRSNA